MRFGQGRQKYCGWFGWKQALALGLFFLVAYVSYFPSSTWLLTVRFPFISLAVTLYFVIPRKPRFQFNVLSPLEAPGGGNPEFSRFPNANFSFDVVLNLGGEFFRAKKKDKLRTLTLTIFTKQWTLDHLMFLSTSASSLLR
jgi:hypothetical protein